MAMQLGDLFKIFADLIISKDMFPPLPATLTRSKPTRHLSMVSIKSFNGSKNVGSHLEELKAMATEFTQSISIKRLGYWTWKCS